MHLFIYCILLCFTEILAISSLAVYVVPCSSPIIWEDGSLTYPFCTIERARNYLREVRRVTPWRVALYPTYHFLETQTLSLDERDALTHFTAMTKDERNQVPLSKNDYLVELDFPIISGGIPLTNWTDNNGIWKTIVPVSSLAVTQLFVNGRRALRSRMPAVGYFSYEKGLDNRTKLAYQGFVYHENQFNNITLSSTSASEFIIYHSFTTSRHFFSQLFPHNRTVCFSNPSLSVIGNESIAMQTGQRFHLENIYEGMLHQEGSFYFDAQTQILYYHPQKNETFETTIIILPILEVVVSMINVSQLDWNYIGIEHSAWMISTVDRKLPIDGRAAADYLGQSRVTVYLRNSSDVSFKNMNIAHTAGYAIQIDAECKQINIENSHMYDLGAGAIRIGRETSHSQQSPNYIQNVTIENCSLHDGGHIFAMGVAILVQQSTSNILITRNTLYEFFQTAIQIGWSWGYQESFCYNHTISFNYIHHIGQRLLSDLGGIYTCGLLNGTSIENNVLHDIYGYYLADWGVYLADGTSELIVVNNIVYNTGSAAFTMIYGINNKFQNNVLARSSHQSDGALSLYRRESRDHLSFTFLHNIIYDTVNDSARWIFQVQAPDPFSSPFVIMDYNCYFNTYDTFLIFGLGRLVFSEWQETNHDTFSYITDPLFVQAEHDCNFFNLSSDSPAVKNLNFQPIKTLPQWKSGC